MKNLHMLTFILVIVGGLNWLLFGLFNWEIGSLLGGMDAVLSKIVYIVIGLAAVYEVATHKTSCKACSVKSEAPTETPPAPTI